MSKAGERMREGLEEALSIAKGEQPAARIHVNGHAYVPEPRIVDRVDFTGKGRLDEVASSRGAHLEHMSGDRWFLIFYHEDGTESAFWFTSKDLKKPFWEKRQ